MREPTSSPATLMVVEDEDRLRTLVTQFLRAEGFVVTEAADGPEGVACYAEHGPFDLVLLDLNLPTMSGVEVCRRIKRINPTQRIMICSAAIVGEHQSALHALGVAHFLTKPYLPDELVAHIQREVRPAVALAGVATYHAQSA